MPTVVREGNFCLVWENMVMCFRCLFPHLKEGDSYMAKTPGSSKGGASGGHGRDLHSYPA